MCDIFSSFVNLIYQPLHSLLDLCSFMSFQFVFVQIVHLSIRSKSHTCPGRPAVTCLSTEGLGVTFLSPKGLGIGMALRRGFGITYLSLKGLDVNVAVFCLLVNCLCLTSLHFRADPSARSGGYWWSIRVFVYTHSSNISLNSVTLVWWVSSSHLNGSLALSAPVTV